MNSLNFLRNIKQSNCKPINSLIQSSIEGVDFFMFNLRKFKNVVEPFAFIVIVLLSLYALYVNYSDQNVLPLLSGLVPLLLVLVTVIGFGLKKAFLPAHLILLFAIYRESGSGFIQSLTSFDFDTMAFSIKLTLEAVINFLIFVYLVVYALSYVSDNKVNSKFKKSEVIVSAIIAFIFFYFRSGFSVAVLKIIPPVIALMFGSELFAIILLLAGVIDVPFTFINHIVESTLFDQSIGYFLFTAFAFYLIYGATTGIIKKLK